MNLSKAFQHISNDPNIGDKGGAIAVMTGERVTRPDYTVQSIQMAITALNPTHYKCGPAAPLGINHDYAAARAEAEMFDWSCGFLVGCVMGVVGSLALTRLLR